MVFAAVRTHFPRKNTLVYLNTVTCVTVATSNRVEVHRLNSQNFAIVRTSNSCRASAFTYFLSTTMVFAVVRTHFSKKNTRVNINRAAINNYINSCLSIKMKTREVVEVVWWLTRSFSFWRFRDAGSPPRGKSFFFFLFFPSFFFW